MRITPLRFGVAKIPDSYGRLQAWADIALEHCDQVWGIDVGTALEPHLSRLDHLAGEWRKHDVQTLITVSGRFFSDVFVTIRNDVWQWLSRVDGSFELDLSSSRERSWPFLPPLGDHEEQIVVRAEVHQITNRFSVHKDIFRFQENRIIFDSDDRKELGEVIIPTLIDRLTRASQPMVIHQGLIRVLDYSPDAPAFRGEPDLCRLLSERDWTVQFQFAAAQSRSASLRDTQATSGQQPPL